MAFLSRAQAVSPLERSPKLPCPLRVGVRFWASLTLRKLAKASGRIVFNIALFMDWQFSSVSFHPAFRRRSFLRLRTASVLSDGDFHPTVGAHSQAHIGTRSRAIRGSAPPRAHPGCPGRTREAIRPGARRRTRARQGSRDVRRPPNGHTNTGGGAAAAMGPARRGSRGSASLPSPNLVVKPGASWPKRCAYDPLRKQS